jgi:hypothetical protein
MKRTGLKRTEMPPRAAPMRLCGKQYGSVAEAEESAAGKRPGAVIETWCPCGAIHVRQPAALSQVLPVLPAGRPATGFPLRVKLLVRARAGFGETGDAMCEACGRHLGRLGGQVHHVAGRGMGGCTLAVINGPANAALLCGTPLTGCHGLATAFDAGIGRRGFWLKHAADPRLHKMVLHSGVDAWRTEDGRYRYTDPRREAA